jgi:hypothetical protein
LQGAAVGAGIKLVSSLINGFLVPMLFAPLMVDRIVPIVMPLVRVAVAVWLLP